MPEVILDARSLSKQFLIRSGVLQRRPARLRAVDAVSLSIEAGRSVGLVGESGCGKSTLARLMMGLILPTSGDVRFRGTPLRALTPQQRRQFHREVQIIFQDPMNSLNPRMRVADIVAEPLIIHHLLPSRRISARVEELLRAVRLPPTLLRSRPRALSGGERQRVGIARALATDPRLLICDEPIASLDVSVGAQLLLLLRRLREERGMALLFISHDLGAVASLCDRIAVMQQGRLVETAPTETLMTRPRDPYTALLIRSAALDLDAPDRPSVSSSEFRISS